MNERRTAADFVAAVCALARAAHGTISALGEAVAGLRGPGADELREAVAGPYVEPNAPDRLDALAARWEARCLASLAVAIRSDGLHKMTDYLTAVAIADATSSWPSRR